MQIQRTKAWRVVRRTAIGAVLVVGVAASVATSGGYVSHQTDSFEVALVGLDGTATQSVRLCPSDQFSWDNSEVTYRVSASLDDGGEARIPLTLSLRDIGSRDVGFLDGSSATLEPFVRARVSDGAEWGDCSPWVDVVANPPRDGTVSGRLRWRVRISADVEAPLAFSRWPWEDSQGHLEVMGPR